MVLPPSSRRQATVHRTFALNHSNLCHKINNGKFQKELPIIWSECRDSNSRPLEPHFYGSFGIPQYLLANCVILSLISKNIQTFFYIGKTSGQSFAAEVVDDWQMTVDSVTCYNILRIRQILLRLDFGNNPLASILRRKIGASLRGSYFYILTALKGALL